MRAIGFTCGIGSMLVGAKQAGFDIVGNIEWRKYYHRTDEQGRNTFRENFPGAFFVHNIDRLTPEQLELATGCDLAMGHPECGKYSQMNNNNANFREQLHDPGDIPIFTGLVAKLKPRFFVMDDLPKSLIAYKAEDYAAALPDYDLFFEWISNYHYGNVQKNRRRLFVIGARKEEGFVFRPGEFEHLRTVSAVIEDLLGKEHEGINAHYPHALDEPCAKAQHLMHRGHNPTWQEVKDFLADKPGGYVIPYTSNTGERKTRPGSYKAHWEGHGHVLDGGSPAIHPVKGVPFSIRERARIQGFPDDFNFYGIKLNEEGEWNHDKNIEMVKQTGKAMPIQFCRYAAGQIAYHIKGQDFPAATMTRCIKPDAHISEAKRWYCKNVGYTHQIEACLACWNPCPVPGAEAATNATITIYEGKPPASPVEAPTGRALRSIRVKRAELKAPKKRGLGRTYREIEEREFTNRND